VATVGGSVIAGTSIVDVIESKEFYKRIDPHLEDFNKKLKSLEDIWKVLHDVVEELKKG